MKIIENSMKEEDMKNHRFKGKYVMIGTVKVSV